MSRSDGWWEGYLADPEWMREGASGHYHVVHESPAGEGFATYRIRPTWSDDGLASYTMEVWDLLATTPSSRTALWCYCLDVDLVTTVKHLNVPVDEPLRWQLAQQFAEDIWFYRRDNGDVVGIGLNHVDEVPAALDLALPAGIAGA